METSPAKKKKLTATLPDGTIATRTTHREYAYVVAVFSIGHGDVEPSWGALAWASRYDLAAKQARQWAHLGKIEIVPVPVEIGARLV